MSVCCLDWGLCRYREGNEEYGRERGGLKY